MYLSINLFGALAYFPLKKRKKAVTRAFRDGFIHLQANVKRLAMP